MCKTVYQGVHTAYLLLSYLVSPHVVISKLNTNFPSQNKDSKQGRTPIRCGYLAWELFSISRNALRLRKEEGKSMIAQTF